MCDRKKTSREGVQLIYPAQVITFDNDSPLTFNKLLKNHLFQPPSAVMGQMFSKGNICLKFWSRAYQNKYCSSDAPIFTANWTHLSISSLLQAISAFNRVILYAAAVNRKIQAIFARPMWRSFRIRPVSPLSVNLSLSQPIFR